MMGFNERSSFVIYNIYDTRNVSFETVKKLDKTILMSIWKYETGI